MSRLQADPHARMRPIEAARAPASSRIFSAGLSRGTGGRAELVLSGTIARMGAVCSGPNACPYVDSGPPARDGAAGPDMGAVFESVPQPVIVVCGRMAIAALNKEARAALGVRTSDAVGHVLTDWMDSDSGAAVRRMAAGPGAGGRPSLAAPAASASPSCALPAAGSRIRRASDRWAGPKRAWRARGSRAGMS